MSHIRVNKFSFEMHFVPNIPFFVLCEYFMQLKCNLSIDFRSYKKQQLKQKFQLFLLCRDREKKVFVSWKWRWTVLISEFYNLEMKHFSTGFLKRFLKLHTDWKLRKWPQKSSLCDLFGGLKKANFLIFVCSNSAEKWRMAFWRNDDFDS